MPDPAELSPEGQAYLNRLQRITEYVDPLRVTEASLRILAAAESLSRLPSITRETLTAWIEEVPANGYVLGLAVGLSQEKQRNLLRAQFGTAAWPSAARQFGADAVISWLDDEYDAVRSVANQMTRQYSFGDILVARGASRTTASSAGTAGRVIEDAVEEIVVRLGLPYRMRGRFLGKNGETGPADLAIPNFDDAAITIACKGFDSTGSKLTAAVTEVQTMAEVRYASQYVFAIVDGIGWHMRQGDFRRMYALHESHRIDGLYTLADLRQFEVDLLRAAQHKGLLPR